MISRLAVQFACHVLQLNADPIAAFITLAYGVRDDPTQVLFQSSLRTIVIGSISGIMRPAISRPVDCHFIVLSST
jgi:hypothetical protein